VHWGALGATRRAVSALWAVGAYPDQPYRSLPRTPVELRVEQRRLDASSPGRAASQAARLVVLLCTQTPHWLELTEIRQLKACCASYFESQVDRDSGAYFLGSDGSDRAELLGAAGHALDALEWLDLPPHRPERLIETCLAHLPRGSSPELLDWVRVLFHCTRFSDHRRGDLAKLGAEVMAHLLALRDPGGGLAPACAGASLASTAAAATALAMWQQVCDWSGPRWTVVRR
jgi:hypothetical protein